MATEFQDWDLSRLAYEYRAAGHSMSAAMASLSSRITAELERRDDRRRRLEASHARLVTFVRRWREIIDGGSRSSEGWSREFDDDARDALTEAEAIAKETT